MWGIYSYERESKLSPHDDEYFFRWCSEYVFMSFLFPLPLFFAFSIASNQTLFFFNWSLTDYGAFIVHSTESLWDLMMMLVIYIFHISISLPRTDARARGLPLFCISLVAWCRWLKWRARAWTRLIVKVSYEMRWDDLNLFFVRAEKSLTSAVVPLSLYLPANRSSFLC